MNHAESLAGVVSAPNSHPEGEPLPCCVAHWANAPEVGNRSPWMPREGLEDEEGLFLPNNLPPLVDAHVHVFPDALFRAVWRWFDAYGWPIRYKFYADEVIRHLQARGVTELVLLHYAHKAGMARSMNAFMADVVKRHVHVTGLATVYPGETGQVEILEEAFAQGLRGVKLHCHVQALPSDDARMLPIYELCQARGLPVVIHAGREPWSGNLPCDPYEVCQVQRIEHVLKNFPRLKLCVPHLGADEFVEYTSLLRKYEFLWLDTTMMIGGYFPIDNPWQWVLARPDRILFGSDFPNLPYAWDREANAIAQAKLPTAVLENVVGKNARALFGL
ncbi:MAG TPA: amidohydrolase family protein [Polyangium sp.]|nr:amidohydrolase family protein [Polyangium sp.]